MIEDDNIEKLFGEVFENFEVNPPSAVKAGIDKTLRGKSKALIFWSSTSLLLVLLAFLFTFFSQSSKSTNHLSQASRQLSARNDTEVAPTIHTIVPENSGSKNPEKSGTDNSEQHSAALLPSSPANTGHSTSTWSSSASKIAAKSADQDRKTGVSVTNTPGKSDKTLLRGYKKSTSGKSEHIHQNQVKPTTNVQSEQDSFQAQITDPEQKSSLSSSASLKSPASNEQTAGSPVSNSGNLAAMDPENSASIQTTDELNTPSAGKSDSISSSQTNKTQPSSAKSITDGSNTDVKRWYAEIQPGIGFIQAQKPAQAVSSQPGFGITGGIYRNFGKNTSTRAGIDFGYQYGSYKWAQFTANTTQTTMDSIHTYYNPNDSTTYTDTVYYVVTTSDSVKAIEKASFTQLSFGLSTQFDLPLTDKFGLVVSPAFRFASSKYLRNSDGTTFRGKNFQLGLGLDCYYDWKYWRFTIGLGSSETWIKTSQNPFGAKSYVQFVPRIGIGLRF